MVHLTEASDIKEPILIVESSSTPFSEALAEFIRKKGAEVEVSGDKQNNLSQFSHIFFIDQKISQDTVLQNKDHAVIYIFIRQADHARALAKISVHQGAAKARFVNLTSHQTPAAATLDHILWFALTTARENLLVLHTLPSSEKKPKKQRTVPWKLLLFLLLFVHLLPLPLMGITSYTLYRGVDALEREDVAKTNAWLQRGTIVHMLSNVFYHRVRPTYLFLTLALTPDTLLLVNDRGLNLLRSSLSLRASSSQTFTLLLKRDKAAAEKKVLLQAIASGKKEALRIESDLRFIGRKLPALHPRFTALSSRMNEVSDTIQKTQKIFPHLEVLLAKNGEKKYLLLFANNMELRPGGGFIGSWGILTMRDLTLESIEVFDVYDADGQLTEHIEPPPAIKVHLNQPNWFFRDSAFSPGFAQNYTQAKFFLEKELGTTGFDGALLVTTTAIQNLLSAFDPITLPDFNETVTKENFYIKAQLYAEQKFFPGSIQKKSFLSSLMRAILIQADGASLVKLASELKKSFDEKQLALIVEDPAIQPVVENLYWSGETITPKCPTDRPNCIIDYIFPYDANLGVNKANFFVGRTLSMRIQIASDGTAQNTFSLRLRNDSPPDVFPGGPYKNYFQLMLPADSQIRRITKNNVLVDSYDETVAQTKTVGFLAETPPSATSEIAVTYRLGGRISPGRQLYELVVQKQLGSKNSDFRLEIILPKNIKLVTQNFSALVKGNHISYNTNLTADKIFLLELERK